MKRTISILLVGAFLHLTAIAKDGCEPIPQPPFPKPPPGYSPPPSNGQILLGLLVVGLAFYAGCKVIKVCRIQYGDEYNPHIYVLERSYDHSSWIPVATNIAIVAPADMPNQGLFTDAKKDSCAFYRVVDRGLAP